jgi:hypothetical protein
MLKPALLRVEKDSKTDAISMTLHKGRRKPGFPNTRTDGSSN